MAIVNLQGEKLLSHDELYEKFHEMAQEVYHLLSKEKIKEMVRNVIKNNLKISQELIQKIDLSPFDEVYYNVDYRFETYNNWDIVLGVKLYHKHLFPVFNIEYKTHVKEWGKSFHDFLNQINKRPAYEGDNIKVLLTFDKRFEKYRDPLEKNNIILLILPQSILNNMKGGK